MASTGGILEAIRAGAKPASSLKPRRCPRRATHAADAPELQAHIQGVDQPHQQLDGHQGHDGPKHAKGHCLGQKLDEDRGVFAPSAFWTPMILVRSRTDTTMMLAMLKQPTRMANIAMNPPPTRGWKRWCPKFSEHVHAVHREIVVLTRTDVADASQVLRQFAATLRVQPRALL